MKHIVVKWLGRSSLRATFSVEGQLECRALLFVLGAKHDLNVIQTNFVKKCLEMFAEIVEQKDDDKKVYEQFGKCLKIVMREDSTNRAKISELLKFNASKSGDEQISRKEYVDHKKDGQNDVYNVTSESIAVTLSWSTRRSTPLGDAAAPAAGAA